MPPSPAQVSDVLMLSPSHDVGARNERHLVAVYSNKESGFEVVHGMLNRVMEALGVPYKGEMKQLVVIELEIYSSYALLNLSTWTGFCT
jgi:phenylalanyl-tRNA synthetase beta subunit